MIYVLLCICYALLVMVNLVFIANNIGGWFPIVITMLCGGMAGYSLVQAIKERP